MKNNNLEQVSSAILALSDTKSDKQLYSQIVETAMSLMKAEDGVLFSADKDRIKKTYSSGETIKKTRITVNKQLTKLIASNHIKYLSCKDLQSLQIKNIPIAVNFVAFIPFTHTKQLLGFLLLFFHNDKRQFTSTERDLLSLYSHTTVLALTKAQLQKESQKALEVRDRFISLASHELRTPLTSIHGYIQLLHQRMKSQQTVESRWMNELYIESVRMTTLVKELLDVNRIKQGQFAFIFSEVQIHDVVTRALERYRLMDANHPFEFQSKLTSQKIKVVGDFDKLVEMVSGLLGNAVKFSKPGAIITITLRDNPNMVSLEVKDTGRGISKQDLTAILNGFYKSDHDSHIEGMGVGLLLAQHIVNNHRGKLKITSKKDKGTSVTVSLPTIKTVTH